MRPKASTARRPRPGIAISVGVFGFNRFGDSLRDALDAKLRGR